VLTRLNVEPCLMYNMCSSLLDQIGAPRLWVSTCGKPTMSFESELRRSTELKVF